MPGRPDEGTIGDDASGATDTSGGAPSSPHAAASSDDARARHPAARDYELGVELGRGGMGRVFRARDRRLGREVAIKELIRPGPEARARFEREARITALLQHPAIIPVYEVVTPRSGDGEPYYAMRLVAGTTLADRIAAATPLERRALVRHVLTVAEAMAYAHGQRIIHRDLKASNVIVGEHGETVVIDWGLAKRLGEDDAAAPDAGPKRYTAPGYNDELTIIGAILGTPAYMSPEQAAGKAIDARTDVYAIGAMLYHTLAGAMPYRGRSSREILAEVVAGPPPPLVERVPDVPRDLAAIVARAMARDPDARYATARELAADLDRFLAGQLVATHRYATRELVARWMRRHRAPVTVAAIAIAAGVAGGAFAFRNVIRARDDARADRVAAEQARAIADTARNDATARADDAILASARAAVATDPRGALERLAMLSRDAPQWAPARTIIADALSRGIARPLDDVTDVGTAAVSADGTLVIAGRDGYLRAPAGAASTFTPARLATVARDGSAIAWLDGTDAVVEPLGAERRRVALPAGVTALAVSPGGTHLIAVAATGLHLADVLAGTTRALGPAFPEGGDWQNLGFSADGNYVLAGRQWTSVIAWRLDGTPARLPRDTWGMATSPDGGWLAYKTQAGVTLRDRAGAEQTIHPDGGGVSLVFAPGGRWLAWRTPFEKSVHLYDLREKKHHLAEGHAGIVAWIAFDATGNLMATTSEDGTARVWDLRWVDILGEPVRDDGLSSVSPVFDLGEAGAWVGFAPGDVLAIASANGRVWRWPIPFVDQRHVAAGTIVSADRHWTVELHGSQLEVARIPDGPARTLDDVWHFEDLLIGKRLVRQAPAPVLAAAAPVLVAATKGGVHHWNLDEPAATRWPVPGELDVVAVSPDGAHVVTHALTGEVHLLAAGAPPRLVANVHERSYISFAPDNRHVALCRLTATVLRVADGTRVALPEGETCAFSPSGDAIAIGGTTTALSLCTLADGHCRTLADGVGATMLRVGTDGVVVAELDRGKVALWDAQGVRHLLGRHRGRLKDLALSADNRTVVSAGNGPEIAIRDVVTGESRLVRAPLDAPDAIHYDGTSLLVADSFTLTRFADDLPRDEAGLRAAITSALR